MIPLPDPLIVSHASSWAPPSYRKVLPIPMMGELARFFPLRGGVGARQAGFPSRPVFAVHTYCSLPCEFPRYIRKTSPCFHDGDHGNLKSVGATCLLPIYVLSLSIIKIEGLERTKNVTFVWRAKLLYTVSLHKITSA